MIITKEKMITDLNITRRVLLHTVFLLIGIAVPLIPLIVVGKFTVGSVIGFVSLLVIFGIPFGYFLGARYIYKALQNLYFIRKGNMRVLVDRITTLEAVQVLSPSKSAKPRYRATLDQYSKDTGWALVFTTKDYDDIQTGNTCVLFFVGQRKSPLLTYPGNQYVLDADLRRFQVNNKRETPLFH